MLTVQFAVQICLLLKIHRKQHFNVSIFIYVNAQTGSNWKTN